MKNIDLHIHTIATVSDKPFDFDLSKLKEYTNRLEIDAIAITNHNVFDFKQYNEIVKELDIKNGPIFGFQIFLNNIPVVNKQNTEKKIKYVVSNFQKIERDFAFIIDKKFEAEKIINVLLNVDKKLIKKLRVFDVFQGGNIEKNKKSIALNLLIQSQDKTLNDKEIEQLSDKVITTMQNSFDATLRS